MQGERIYEYPSWFHVEAVILMSLSFIGLPIFIASCMYFWNKRLRIFAFANFYDCFRCNDWAAYLLSHFPIKIITADNGLYLKGWFGKEEAISWNQVVSSRIYSSFLSEFRWMQYRIVGLRHTRH